VQRNDSASAQAGDSDYWREIFVRITERLSPLRSSHSSGLTIAPQSKSGGETMLKSFLTRALLGLTIALAPTSLFAQTFVVDLSPQKTQSAIGNPIQRTALTAIEQTRLLVEEIVRVSYPELKHADIQVQSFNSAADYFRTSFSFGRFLSAKKMRYFIKVNPRVFELNAPAEGVRAIVAHELGHIFDFHGSKRIRLLRLVRLSSKGYSAAFERRTDLQAIARGYAEGLKAYRHWLYQNVPARKLAEKRRNYFSPEEIEALELKRRQKPDLMRHWFKHPPRSLEEISVQ
jgi:hypothetical protein